MSKGRFIAAVVACWVFAQLVAGVGRCEDWPTWRHDANRSAATPEELRSSLHLAWVRELPVPRPAWPGEPRAAFDAVHEPVAAGRTLFLGLNCTDRVIALDTRTGQERWSFYAGGPVRFAPLVWEGRVYFPCDDGNLYCLRAEDGSLAWRFRAAPQERRVLGNGRLISTWPARGAPVIVDDVLYFGAGIFPFMGTFLYALDPRSGEVIWSNDGIGPYYNPQEPHGSGSFGGVAPQGYLAAAGDRLVVPCGRARAALFDRGSGTLQPYYTGWKGGHCFVAGTDRFFFMGPMLFGLEEGLLGFSLADRWYSECLDLPVLADTTAYVVGKEGIAAYALGPVEIPVEHSREWKRDYEYKLLGSGEKLRPLPLDPTPAAERIWLKAGQRLFAGGSGELLAIDLPAGDGPLRIGWQASVDGEIGSVIAADGRLFVSTREGHLYCYGPDEMAPKRHPRTVEPVVVWDEVDRAARAILEASGTTEGFALVLGPATEEFLAALAQRSDLHVIAVDPDERRADAIRRRLDGAGLYGERIEVHVGRPADFAFPPYLADLVVCAADGGSMPDAEALFRVLRPYGGVACLELSEAGHRHFASQVADLDLSGAEVRREGACTLLTRAGALPGAGDWTHEGADAGNTLTSNDSLVRVPLGLLWFGGPSDDIPYLDRHQRTPRPQVVDGRVVVEAKRGLYAVDAYTGRVLWERTLTGLEPLEEGAAGRWARVLGSNYASVGDGVYVLHGAQCTRIEPATGRTLGEFDMGLAPAERFLPWGSVRVWEDLLVLTPEALAVSQEPVQQDGGPAGEPQDMRYGIHHWNGAASPRLVAMDRFSGAVLWEQQADRAFRHTAVAVGGGKVFCMDHLAEDFSGMLKRRAGLGSEVAVLKTFDARTGMLLWRKEQEDILAANLHYSEQYDVLVCNSSFYPRAERGGVATYRGADGTPLWSRAGRGMDFAYVLIHGDTLVLAGKGYSLDEGRYQGWSFGRGRSCDDNVAGENILAFRSGSAGYYDFAGKSGTGNLSGLRPGCHSSLIPAGGILNAPKCAEGCVCNYPNQTSAAFVHDPEAELWTWGSASVPTSAGFGVNLGAPGNRLAADGVMWFEYPEIGGPADRLSVTVLPAEVTWYRKHPARMAGEGLRWVAASGAEGLESLAVKLPAEGVYTIRLHFAEPDALAPGERVFDVALQGRVVLKGFDVVKEAGGPLRPVVKSFQGVRVDDGLSVTFRRRKGEPLLCGVELAAQ